MTKQEYEELQRWLSSWKANQRAHNSFAYRSAKESEAVDAVLRSVKSKLKSVYEGGK